MDQNTSNFIKKHYPFFIILLLVVTLIIVIYNCQKEEIPVQPYEVKPQELGAGKIGEIPDSSLSARVFNTTGTIIEVKENYLTVRGSGTNFADEKPRTLKLFFTEETTTFEPGQKKYYKGLDGLKYLKSGMKILINGDENIRGKTEFIIKTINVI